MGNKNTHFDIEVGVLNDCSGAEAEKIGEFIPALGEQAVLERIIEFPTTDVVVARCAGRAVAAATVNVTFGEDGETCLVDGFVMDESENPNTVVPAMEKFIELWSDNMGAVAIKHMTNPRKSSGHAELFPRRGRPINGEMMRAPIH
jgi:hypothetical protein